MSACLRSTALAADCPLAALVSIIESDIAYLGRWCPSTASGYVRTATEVVMRIQGTVADYVRADLEKKSGEHLGEQAAYMDMRKELSRRGFSDAVVDGHFEELRGWTTQLVMDVSGVEESKGRVTDEESEASADDCGWEFIQEPPEEEAGKPASVTPPTVSPEPEEPIPAVEPGLLPVEGSHPSPPETGFVVSLSRSGWRRLHRLGGCKRMPGVHYLRYELLGQDKPDVDDYDDYCRQCWPAHSPEEDTEDDDDSETDQEETEEPFLNLRNAEPF